ncbi:MAG: hypothetical protein J0H89_07840, partial [Rhizobiales bacterium]|nr:hypothetical protein [Hyphomicrobiales bacterium]
MLQTPSAALFSPTRNSRILRNLAIAAAAVLLAATAPDANAQTGTIKIVVPSSAGGGADILSRLLADQISRMQGATMIVENRPGAGNTIGTEAVSLATPDGNTV